MRTGHRSNGAIRRSLESKMNPIKKNISEKVQVCGRKKGHISLASKTEKRDDINELIFMIPNESAYFLVKPYASVPKRTVSTRRFF